MSKSGLKPRTRQQQRRRQRRWWRRTKCVDARPLIAKQNESQTQPGMIPPGNNNNNNNNNNNDDNDNNNNYRRLSRFCPIQRAMATIAFVNWRRCSIPGTRLTINLRPASSNGIGDSMNSARKGDCGKRWILWNRSRIPAKVNTKSG